MKDTTYFEMVKDILINHPDSREDDLLLYGFMMNALGHSMHTSFAEVWELIRKKELPPFDTARRLRSKVQELFPELASSKKATRARLARVPDYQEIAFTDKTFFKEDSAEA